MTSGIKAKSIVKKGITISRAAREKTFEEMLGPGREVDEAELDKIVDKARPAHTAKKRSKS